MAKEALNASEENMSHERRGAQKPERNKGTVFPFLIMNKQGTIRFCRCRTDATKIGLNERIVCELAYRTRVTVVLRMIFVGMGTRFSATLCLVNMDCLGHNRKQ